MADVPEKKLKSIPTSKLARGFKLAKLTASVGLQSLGGKINSMVGENVGGELATRLKQAENIANTLSQMKGAAMKLGQLLSMHGEHLFPKEVVAILSKLQQNSQAMEFSEIEKIVKKELGPHYFDFLKNLSTEPIAAASIGQVHEAVFQDTRVAVKIQYPGVSTSIDSDVDTLSSLVSVLTKFPSAAGLTEVTDEIKTILKLETDYEHELRNIELFRDFFKSDSSLVIPKPFPKVSTKNILTTELVDGLSVQSFAESTASENARNFIGKKFIEIFYSELLGLGRVQTDPNFANYKIKWSFGIQEPKLVLLDFGATKQFSPDFRKSYKEMIRACYHDDYEGIKKGAMDVGFLRPDDSKELVELHYQFVKMFMEPFHSKKPYAWGEDDLPERIRKFMPSFIMAFKLRPPPRDFIFLNRKVIGVYFFCSAIKARFDPRPILSTFLED